MFEKDKVDENIVIKIIDQLHKLCVYNL